MPINQYPCICVDTIIDWPLENSFLLDNNKTELINIPITDV